jgi:signal transduction histidine kinase
MTVSFNRMADAMENAEENRRGLIASVSHDLRTPMTTIGGFVDGILDGTIKPENQTKYLHIISDEVKRLSRLASSMVEVSRLESGTRVMTRAVFDMSELVRRVVISFEQKLSEKRIEVTLDIPDTQNMNGDHDGMFQVVYNLMDNAVKFTDIGGSITIFMEEKAGKIKFHIVNTGGEIPAEDLRRIFDRFFKGDQSRNTSGAGSGLGLYIVKTIVGRHGGDVYAQSHGGKTEFVFTVPTDGGAA